MAKDYLSGCPVCGDTSASGFGNHKCPPKTLARLERLERKEAREKLSEERTFSDRLEEAEQLNNAAEDE